MIVGVQVVTEEMMSLKVSIHPCLTSLLQRQAICCCITASDTLVVTVVGAKQTPRHFHITSTSNLRPQRSKNVKKTTYACVVVVSSMVVDILGLDVGQLRRYSETKGNDWLWTGVIEQCLNDDNERLQSNETEKLEEKNRRFKCPYESFPTFTCTD